MQYKNNMGLCEAIRYYMIQSLRLHGRQHSDINSLIISITTNGVMTDRQWLLAIKPTSLTPRSESNTKMHNRFYETFNLVEG